MTTRISSFASTPTSPARRLHRITPSDTSDFEHGPARLFVARGGQIRVLLANAPDNEPVTLIIGYEHCLRPIDLFVRRVMTTGTDPLAVVYAIEE